MSMKLLVGLRVKYSSAMFRPPMTAIAPSAMNSLLCIRRLSRLMSNSDAMYLPPMLSSRAAKRIEQPHLHVRERGQATKHRVAARRVEVVHQQPHAYAARRRVAQLAHQQAARAIVLNQVILDVERVAGSAGKLDPASSQ